MHDPSDSSPVELLVADACAGDRRAMTELHRRYSPMVHSIVLAKAPRSESDDVVQDVFVQAMSRLPTLKRREAFGSWIAAIARNATADHHRRKRSTNELDERDAPISATAVRRLQALEVLEAIQRLPEGYAEVLVMRLVEGMSGPEIAERCGMKPGSVRIKLHRGLKMLRGELGQEEGQS